MAQVNLHVTEEFAAALEALMRGRGLRSKSEAIRLAVREAAAPYRADPPHDLSLLTGLLARHQGRPHAGPSASQLEDEIDRELERALGEPAPAPSGPRKSRRAK